MPDTDELEVRDDAQWELFFVIEGIEIAWCSHRHLESLSTGEGHTVRRGLERKGMRRRLEVGMREPEIVPNTMRIRLSDHTGDLATLFAADRDDWEDLEFSIAPDEDLSARTQVHDMHVGTERIGPAGERRLYPVPLGDTLGREHYAGSYDSQLGALPTRVSSAPIQWVGRRCALYRVYRDHITYPGDYSEGWRPASEWRKIWWGAMRDDGRVSGRVWELECGGPETWLQKDLGLLTQRTPVNVTPQFVYSAEEAEGAGWVGRFLPASAPVDNGDVGFSVIFTGTTLEELRSEFDSLVDSIREDSGTAGAWSDYSGNVLTTLGGGRSVAFRHSSDSPGADTSRATLFIALHRRMWERLGWDLSQSEVRTDGAYEFVEVPGVLTDEAPGDGYIALKVELFLRDQPIYEVEPRFNGGVAQLDPTRINSDGQVLNLSDGTPGEVSHNGQTWAPVASDPADATIGYDLDGLGESDTQGFWLLQGERRFAGQEDTFEEAALLQCSWVDYRGTVFGNQVVATRMWSPRRVGINRPMLASSWSQQSGGIQARPLLYLGYQQSNGYDLAHLVMQRLLLSTGTSEGWSSFSEDQPITSDPGDNDPPILAGFVRLDTERADLGLAIPRDMVQAPIDFQNAAQTAEEQALEVFVAIEPGTNSEDVLDGLMTPLGFAWSLAGGAYGIFTPHDPIEESEVLWVLTRAQQEGRYGEMVEPEQDLREYAPVDAFNVKASRVAYEDEYRYEAKIDAIDDGRRYRPGGIIEDLEAPYHRRSNSASVALRGRQSARARFWARRHYTVRGFDVLPSIGRRIWPGEGARITHPLLVDPVASAYGVTARRARILAIEEDLSRDRSGFRVDFLAYAERTTTPRVHAPIARGYGFDSDTDTILVVDDCLGLGNGWNDAATFVEPEYVGLEQYGGALEVEIWQWAGTGLALTCTGVVGSVDTTPGASSITLSSITGTYLPCADAIVMPITVDQQSALFAQTLFVGIGDESGSTGAGDNQRFEDV